MDCDLTPPSQQQAQTPSPFYKNFSLDARTVHAGSSESTDSSQVLPRTYSPLGTQLDIPEKIAKTTATVMDSLLRAYQPYDQVQLFICKVLSPTYIKISFTQVIKLLVPPGFWGCKENLAKILNRKL